MTIKISKQLATMQDLAIGSGQVVQRRNGVDLTLDKIDFVPRVTSIAAMEASPSVIGAAIQTLGYVSAGDGAGNTYRVVAGGTGTNDGINFIDLENGLQARLVPSETTTFLIPTDFPDIQSVIDLYTGTDSKTKRYVDIFIEAGHQLTKGAEFKDGDFKNFSISSADAIVTLSASFVGVEVSDVFTENSLFLADRATAPALNCLVDMEDLYGCGLVIYDQSIGMVRGDCGVINAGAFGLYVLKQSSVSATQCNFSGAGWGNRVTTNSLLQAPTSNWSGSKNANYLVVNTTANMDVSRGSFAYVTGSAGNESNLTNSAGRGLAVRRSYCSATSVDCSGAGLEGLNAALGATVAFTASFADDCGMGIFATGANVDASTSSNSAKDCTDFNVFSNNGGKISLRGGTFTGAGINGIRADNGSTIVATSCDCRKSAGVDNSLDIVVTKGSIIHAVDAVGGTYITPLTLTSDGLIFK